MSKLTHPEHPKPRLLVIEDEEPIRIGLTDTFVFHGFEVESASDGNQGLSLALDKPFDLILLDLMLPGKSGFEVCEAIRSCHPNRAIIMLTAMGTERDIIEGLKLGADDYVTKPFSVTELVLRVKSVLRRTQPEPPKYRRFSVGCLTIDCDNLEVARADTAEKSQLTKRELETLCYLAENRDRAVQREELLEAVWGYKNGGALDTRTVDIHIAKLRRKLEVEPKNPQLIQTVRGGGYRLT
ncbi:MAG: response regulator transcription factor [Hahellaceae bacterium]|nr:response regulator transcription factor [Hahellaceae bacterium]